MICLSAQPDEPFFAWQLMVQITNFREFGLSDKMHVLIRYEDTINPLFKEMEENYPEVNFFYYKDNRYNRKVYVPSLRPHIIAQHLSAYRELQNESIFYHDSDIILSRRIDFNSLASNVASTSVRSMDGYLGSTYLREKSESLYQGMCKIVGIDYKLVDDRPTSGAQYYLKNTTPEFWKKIEKDSISLYFYMGRFNRGYNCDVQRWCSDMWALMWNMWLFQDLKPEDAISFAWATNSIEEFNRHPIFHNAGVAKGNKDYLFNKMDFKEVFPFNADFSHVSRSHCSWKYVEAIKKAA